MELICIKCFSVYTDQIIEKKNGDGVENIIFEQNHSSVFLNKEEYIQCYDSIFEKVCEQLNFLFNGQDTPIERKKYINHQNKKILQIIQYKNELIFQIVHKKLNEIHCFYYKEDDGIKKISVNEDLQDYFSIDELF